jgi:hypothetical protein
MIYLAIASLALLLTFIATDIIVNPPRERRRTPRVHTKSHYHKLGER